MKLQLPINLCIHCPSATRFVLIDTNSMDRFASKKKTKKQLNQFTKIQLENSNNNKQRIS